MSHSKGGKGASDYITGVRRSSFAYVAKNCHIWGCSCTESAVAFNTTAHTVLHNLSQTKSISKCSVACMLLSAVTSTVQTRESLLIDFA